MILFKRRRFKVLFISILVVAAAAGTFAVLQLQDRGPSEALASDDSTQETDAKEEEVVKIPVELASAARMNLPNFFRSTGTLEARCQVDLIAKAGGQIVSLAVEEGKMVHEGDILAELDHRQQQLLVEDARVKAETSQLQLDRVEGMAQRELATDRELEEARQNAKVAQYAFEIAQVQLDDLFIRAPFDGQITQRWIEMGQTVAPGERIFKIADISPLQMRLFLPEVVARDLAVGQRVRITPDVQDDVHLTGEVERISPVVDPSTATVKVTLKVEGGPQAARVGSFVRVQVTVDVHEDVISIPKRAIVSEAGANFAFVAEADSVRKVEIGLGYCDDVHIEVSSGLEEEDAVVTVGQGGLKHGSRIRDLAMEEESADDSTEASEKEAEQVAALGS